MKIFAYFIVDVPLSCHVVTVLERWMHINFCYKFPCTEEQSHRIPAHHLLLTSCIEVLKVIAPLIMVHV